MKNARLDNLSDGIFAIVMTLLVFEIKLPLGVTEVDNMGLWKQITQITPSFLSYLLSFALLFTYWKSHHFFTSVYAKNIDANLTNINAVFFMFISLLPFSTNLLSHHSNNSLSVILFSVHTIIIGLCLLWMRSYVFYSKHIQNPEITPHAIYGAIIHTVTPIIFAVVAMLLSLANTSLSLFILTVSIIFNLSPYSTSIIERLFGRYFKTGHAEHF